MLFLNFNKCGKYSIENTAHYAKTNSVTTFIKNIKDCNSVTLMLNNPKFIIEELKDSDVLEKNCFLTKDELKAITDEIKHIIDIYLD